MSIKFNIGQIYHTSHCGSTLMTALLRQSSIVYAEPSWLHQIVNDGNNKIVFNRVLKNYDNGVIIKFPSSLCNYSGHFPGKKVFLYRKLKHHLFKIKSSAQLPYILTTIYNYHFHNCHSSLKEFKFDTDLEKIAFIWLNMISWILEVDNDSILWIESNNFFKDKKKTMDLVCDHMGVERIKNFEIANIHVKLLGMNGNDAPMNDIQVTISDKNRYLYPSYGVIEDDLCDQYPEIRSLVEWIKNNIPSISSNFIL